MKIIESKSIYFFLYLFSFPLWKTFTHNDVITCVSAFLYSKGITPFFPIIPKSNHFYVTNSNNHEVINKRRPAPNKHVALIWVIESIENLGGNPDLIDALKLLQQSRTKKSKHIVERKLRTIDISNESIAIQERVIKACATSGLTLFAFTLLQETFLLQRNKKDVLLFPSVSSYTAILNGLRKLGKIQQMKELLDDLIDRLKRIENETFFDNQIIKGLDIVGFNSYLAALCDNVISPYDKLQMIKGKRRPGDKRYVPSSDYYLNQALDLILQPNKTKDDFCLSSNLDLFSYNTVLAAAARSGDSNAVKAIYYVFQQQQQQQPELKEDIFTYNALLRNSMQIEQYRNQRNPTMISNFEQTKRMNLYKHLNITESFYMDSLSLLYKIISDKNIKPDRFTIDLAFIPLLNDGQTDILRQLLDDYFIDHGTNEYERRTLSNTFAAFLFTLVQGEQLSFGLSIFNEYLLNNKRNQNIPIIAKHFNILIEGYRRSIDISKLKLSLETDKASNLSIMKQAQQDIIHAQTQIQFLFDTMIQRNVRPDAYTFTSLLAIQTSSINVTNLWKRFTYEFQIKLTPPVFHSLISTYGKLNDPMMACYIFDAMVMNIYKGKQTRRTIYTWNTLQAVFADEANSSMRLYCQDDDIQKKEVHSLIIREQTEQTSSIQISNMIHGQTCTEASQSILSFMNQPNHTTSEIIPPPNSQTYCYCAASLSHSTNPNKPNITAAKTLFQDAMNRSIPPDGRFINAIIRCFGSDIDSALQSWKQDIGKQLITYNNIRQDKSQNQNIMAGYHGLFSVCGLAGRPDIAVRLVYAMAKSGLSVNETALRCYEAGKKRRGYYSSNEGNKRGIKGIINPPLQNAMSSVYESILVVECSKYEQTDKRRFGEKRVRIIY